MIQLEIALSDKHFAYLEKLQQEKGGSLNEVLSDLIEADLAWQQLIAHDPITALIGTIADEFNSEQINQLLYDASWQSVAQV